MPNLGNVVSNKEGQVGIIIANYEDSVIVLSEKYLDRIEKTSDLTIEPLSAFLAFQPSFDTYLAIVQYLETLHNNTPYVTIDKEKLKQFLQSLPK